MDHVKRRRAAALGAVTVVAVLATLGVAAQPAAAGTGDKKVSARNGYATHLRASFSEATITDHGESGMTLTIERDPNLTPVDLDGLGFTIELPEDLWVSSGDVDNECTNASFSPNFGDTTLVVSGAELAAAEASCTIGLLVTSRHSGAYVIDDSAVTSTQGDIGAEITPDTLTVTSRFPQLSASFDDDEIDVGGTSELGLALYRSDQNPNVVTSSIAWRLTLPVGLTVASFDSNSCGGTVSAVAGTRIVALSGAVIGAGESYCSTSVNVRGVVGGEYVLGEAMLSSLNKVEPTLGACLASVPDDGEPVALVSCDPRLTVERQSQTVTFPQPGPQKIGASLLTGTASSGLPVSFATSTPAVCTASGRTLNIRTEGVCKVRAVQPGNGTYAPAESEYRTIDILPRPPAPPTVAGTPGESSITLVWTAPEDVSGITSYAATARSGGLVSSCASTGLTCVLGAVAGRPYTLTVVSRGPNGTSTVTTGAGTVTASAPVIPPAPPQTDLDLTTTDGRIDRAEPGQEITFVGTGFAPRSTVLITIYSNPILLGTAITDGVGDFAKPIIIPPDLAAGAHTAVAQGVAPDGTPRAMALDITVRADGGGGGLPVTGPGVATLLLLGVAAVAAGGGLVVAGRPRRRAAL